MVFHANAVTPSFGTKESNGLMGAADGPSSDPTNPDDPPRPEPYSPPLMRSDSWLRRGETGIIGWKRSVSHVQETIQVGRGHMCRLDLQPPTDALRLVAAEIAVMC